MEDKIELLSEIIGASKEFRFIEDEILNIRKNYDTSISININFVAFIEVMYEKLNDEDIERILLTDEEVEKLGDE